MLISPEIEQVKGTFPCDQDIIIEDNEGCAAFVGRVVKGVKNGPSPQWLQDQLKSIGLRPISALVDITNYITYDRARPLHFYDLDKVQGAITVRRAKDEAFDALDDNCLLYTSPSPRDLSTSRMPSSA